MDVPCVEGMSLLRCPCVPPLGVRRVSAAAHMCAAADDPCSFRKCHCEERSDVAIRFPCVMLCVREHGLPHQRARWFAMTRVFASAEQAGGGALLGRALLFTCERPRSRSFGVF